MMNLYFGIVEDRKDPLQLGRVKVRVLGYHSDSLADIPLEGLPWATVMQPTTSSAMSGVGKTSNIVEGTQVILTFTDGSDMQQPLVLGTVPGINQNYTMTVDNTEVPRSKTKGFNDPNEVYPKAEYLDQSDLPKEARGEVTTVRTPQTAKFFTEPSDIRQNHQYPFNQVRKTESGHVEEYDDTPGNERINIQHKSGSFREFRPDGNVVDRYEGSGFEIVIQDKNVYVGGTCNLHINSNCNTFVGGDWNIEVTGAFNVKAATTDQDFSSGTVDISSGEITVSGITHTKHVHTDTPGLGAGTTTRPRG